MISPSTCFSGVSCRSSDPFVMLSHGEIWLGSLPSPQNGFTKCTERKRGPLLRLIVNGSRHQCCHYQGCLANLPRLSLSNLDLLHLPASLWWKQMSVLSSGCVLVQWGMDIASRDCWHALSRSFRNQRWTSREGWKVPWRACEVTVSTSAEVIGGTFDEQTGFFLLALKWGFDRGGCTLALFALI